MSDPRLEVNDGLGRRVIPIDKPTLTIGRRTESDVRLVGSDVSREHAEIVQNDGRCCCSRTAARATAPSSTARPVTEHRLVHGDRVQFGRTGGAEVVFLHRRRRSSSGTSTAGTAVGDIRQMATLLEGLRALGSGRVLDEVLALVLDAAIGVTGAERGFIMLAGDDRALDMKLARARGRVTLPGNRFDTSRKIPEEVFATGELKVVADLLDGDLAQDHRGTVALGIRHVLCTPLRLVRYLDRPDMAPEARAIGVLYLDSREKGQLLSQATRSALDTLANEAGVAIENARLYRETLEKAKHRARAAHRRRDPAVAAARGPARRRVLPGDGRVAAVAVDRRRLLRIHRHGRRRHRRRARRRRRQGPGGGAAHREDPGAVLGAGRRRQPGHGDEAREHRPARSARSTRATPPCSSPRSRPTAC